MYIFLLEGNTAQQGGEVATHAVRLHTTPTTTIVPCAISAVEPNRVEHNTMPTEGRSLMSRSTTRSTINSSSSTNDLCKSGEMGDVSEQARATVADEVRSRFNDVFEVSKSDCNILDESDLERVEECNVAGRLSLPDSIRFFESIGASEFVLKTLREGHFSKFKSPVPPLERKNNGSFFKHQEWAVQEVKNLIKLKKVEVVQEKPYCVLPLHVVVQPKKNRLVLDCGILNEYVVAPKFKLDDYKVALNFFKEKGWIFVFDYKDGYHHVKIHKDFKKYLGFKLIMDGKLTYCQFLVGLLGLADMPYLFTKIFRALIKHWRYNSMLCCIYLDDGWVFNTDFEEASLFSRHVRSDLLKAGVVWSIKKSCWTPSRSVEWLGMVWNAEDLTLKIADRRISKLKTLISELLSKGASSIRQLSSFVGQVISLGPVVGNLTRLRSRYCQMAIAAAGSYDSWSVFTPLMVKELCFWKDNVEELNCRSCKREEPPVSVVVKGDASASGCGSFIVDSALEAARLFSPLERETHSTWRELENVNFSLAALRDELQGRVVNFLIDNKSAVSIIQNGSMKEDCHLLALRIHESCSKAGISLNVQWIPREENKDADSLSRLPDQLDTDDWGISEQFFNIICSRWGPITLDCFANFYNKKVERFYSLFHTPGSAGVNAFMFDWSGENCLLVPPVSVAGRVLNHLYTCKAKGVLVLPLWPSAFYWPMLTGFFKPFIKDFLIVKATNVLILGRNVNSLLGSKDCSSMILALHIDCS